MASRREQPWSNDERNYLLAEVIKANSPHHDVLLDVIRNARMQSRLEDIPLPPGRSLNSCRFAFDELMRVHRPSHLSMSYGPQTPLSAPPATLGKRPFSSEPMYAPGREIRPKLPPTTALAPATAFGQPTTSEPGPKRRRGRPTKAEAEAKARADAAGRSDQILAGPAPLLPLTGPSTPSMQFQQPLFAAATAGAVAGSSVPTEEVIAGPATARMPISAMLTPAQPKSASQSSSSSGKRRRARSTRSEQGASILAGASVPARLDLSQDTPARTAALRHRDEPPQPPPPLPLPTTTGQPPTSGDDRSFPGPGGAEQSR